VNVLTARVAFRDRAALDVFDLALRFVVVQGRAFGKLALFVLVPASAIAWGAARAGGWVVGWSVAVVLATIARVPFTILASRLVFEDDVRTADVLRAAARAVPRVLVARVLWALVILLALSLFFAPALWAASALFYLDEALLLERQGLLRSFARASSIASKSIGEALLGVFALALITVLAVGLTEIGGRTTLSELLEFRPPPSAWTTGGSVLCLLGWFGVVPYLATARFFSYLNVRTRAEGWDIQTRFAAIAARAEGLREAA
jgi:hypothetical protein